MPEFQPAEEAAAVVGGPRLAFVEPSPSPLRIDQGGAVRVGNSRVSLDVVVEKYENGMAAEDLVRAYDSLNLADVHAAIAYYLRHKDEIQDYLRQRQAQATAFKTKIEAERPRVRREELVERRKAAETGDAAAGH